MPDLTRLRLRKNGPIVIETKVEIVDHTGNRLELPEGKPVALCRCGHSETKPFCDGTHRTADWARPD